MAQEILSLIDAWQRSPGPGVLATLVNVRGSSYRRAGARAWITPDGHRVGSISGGCLEADLGARAQRLLDAAPAPGAAELITYDTTAENELLWGVGLGCHGVVQVLLEPLPAPPVWAAPVAEALAAGRPSELVTLWPRAGTPAAAPLVGTRLAKAADLPDPSAVGAFRQTVLPPPPLVIIGAGDDTQPLVRLAAGLGWRVHVRDPRAAYATADRFPMAAHVTVAPAEAPIDWPDDPRLAVVIMTHHYVFDRPALGHALRRPQPPAYLGLLGPRQRAQRILRDLAADGIVPTPEQHARLHAPVGLDLGGDGANAVALAILAELHAVLHQRDARPLRERTAPIHAG